MLWFFPSSDSTLVCDKRLNNRPSVTPGKHSLPPSTPSASRPWHLETLLRPTHAITTKDANRLSRAALTNRVTATSTASTRRASANSAASRASSHVSANARSHMLVPRRETLFPQTCVQFQTAVVLNQNLKPIFFNQPPIFSNLLSFFLFYQFLPRCI